MASPSLPDPAPRARRAAAPWGNGVPDLLAAADAAFFLSFFREDSFPLDSESAGEPALLSDLPFLELSGFFPDGVLVPLEPEPL